MSCEKEHYMKVLNNIITNIKEKYYMKKKIISTLLLCLCVANSMYSQTENSPYIVVTSGGINQSVPFTYSHYVDNIANNPGGIVFYRFTITTSMDIQITFTQSSLPFLFTELKERSLSGSLSDGYTVSNLSAGTYNLMLDGMGYSGSYTMYIYGKSPKPIENPGTVDSSDQNYIRTRTYTNDTGTSYLDQITYYDEVVREFK